MGNAMIHKKINELGITIIEALVSAVIVGIGFIAIFQMVNYSVQSIDISGNRTKSNYLIAMIAEDIIADKYAKIVFTADDPTTPENEEDSLTFAGHLLQEQTDGSGVLNNDECSDTASTTAYKDIDANDSVVENKIAKWAMRLTSNKFTSCRDNSDKSKADIRVLGIIEICSGTTNMAATPNPICGFEPPLLADVALTNDYPGYFVQRMYFGRMQMNLNKGNKRKFLYFPINYEIEDKK